MINQEKSIILNKAAKMLDEIGKAKDNSDHPDSKSDTVTNPKDRIEYLSNLRETLIYSM